MADFSVIAKEVYKVLLQFNYTVSLYTDEGMETTEPEDTRWMFDKKKNLMVSLVEDDDDSAIVLAIGKHTHATEVMGLTQTLRVLATEYNVTFRERNFNQDIDPKRFSQLASVTEAKKDRRMEVLEGMYGTSRSSYLRLENARLIVRHNTRIDDSRIGARGRCIESMFVENAVGERFSMPITQIAPARAMTQHINQGGTTTDQLGQKIIEMADNYVNLLIALRHLGTVTSTEKIVAVTEACRCKMKKLRKTFEQLCHPSSYVTESQKLVEETDEDHKKRIDRQFDQSKAAMKKNVARDRQDKINKAADQWKKTDPKNTELSEESDEEHKKRIDYQTDQSRRGVEQGLERERQDKLNKAADWWKQTDPKKVNDISDGMVVLPESVILAIYEAVVPLLEAKETLGIYDHRVDKEVWENFIRNGEIGLKGRPIYDRHEFNSAVAELIYRLGQIVPMVVDDGLANILSYVADQIIDSPNQKELVQIGLKALKAARAKSIEPEVKEAPTDAVGKTINVLGLPRRVNATAWDNLVKYGRIALSGTPVFDKHRFKSAISELVYRLGQIGPKVQDDTMANLIVDIIDNMVEQPNMAARRPFIGVGMRILKAAHNHVQPEHDLAVHNPVIQEFHDWINRFTTEKILIEGDFLEDGEDPLSGMNPYSPLHSTYEEGVNQAIERFDPVDFVESSIMEDIIDNRDPKNPEENEISKNEVTEGLSAYMRDYVEGLWQEIVGDNTAEDMAKAVYEQAVDELQNRGFTIRDGAMTEGPLVEELELTREDVLLPAKNMGDDLAQEVTKQTVEDPDDKSKEKAPDASYVSRLKVLAGMNSGANSQGY